VSVESWQLALACNAMMMAAYLGICLAIVRPLTRSHQLRSNQLGAATAAIFLTCAVHHGALSLQLLLPALGVGGPPDPGTPTAWGWPLAGWDAIGAVVGVYYWSLRRTYGSLMPGGQLFEDLGQREQQALELNDTVLQGLVVAKLALDLDQPEKAMHALTASISSASGMVTQLLGSQHHSLDLLRSVPAAVALPTPQPTDSLADSNRSSR